MATTYFPIKCIFVQASAPHPENTQYKVSIGFEKWGDTSVIVSKVQMVYDGKVSGRKSPSFPLQSNDFNDVSHALKELQEEHLNTQSKIGGIIS